MPMNLDNADPGWYLIYEDDTSDLLDGGHSDLEGVVKAALLHERIFKDYGPWQALHLKADGNFDICELPRLAVSINEEAAKLCADLVSGHNTSRNTHEH